MIIAIGSNLSAPDGCDPSQNCERALREVANIAGISNVVRSRWYSSAPMPPSGQARYINGAAAFNTQLAPAALLGTLQRIEREAGRVRSVANAARVLDLDIVAMGALVRGFPDPVLPHPRAHLRAFVLLALRDVAPGWRHPVTGRGVQGLLDDLPWQDVRAV